MITYMARSPTLWSMILLTYMELGVALAFEEFATTRDRLRGEGLGRAVYRQSRSSLWDPEKEIDTRQNPPRW